MKQFFTHIAKLSTYKVWLMLSGIILITFVFSLLSRNIAVSTSYLDMMPDNNPKAKALKSILEEFNNTSNIIILAEGEEKRLKEFSSFIKPRLLEFEDWVVSVDDQIPSDFIRKYGLKLLSNSELRNFSNLYNNPNLIQFYRELNNSFEKEFIGEEGMEIGKKEKKAVQFLDGIERFIEIQEKTITTGYVEGYGQQAVDAIVFGDPFQFNMDRTMLMIVLEPKINIFDDRESVIEAVNSIDEFIIDAADEYKVEVGLTGNLVDRRDGMRIHQEYSRTLMLISFFTILLILVISFRMWSSPIIIMIGVIMHSLLMFGFASILIENITTITFIMCAGLVALGLYCAIYIISIFTELRFNGLMTYPAMETTLIKEGPGILTATFTFSAAFLPLILSDNTEVSNVGLLLSLGIILIMFFTVTIIPTLLIVREKVSGKFNSDMELQRYSSTLLGVIAEKVSRIRKTALIFISIITIILFWYGIGIDIDYNYLNLHPVSSQSSKIQEKLDDSFNLYSNPILFSVYSLDSARALTERVRNKSTIGLVESVTDYLPDEINESDRFNFIRNLRRDLIDTEINKNLSKTDLEVYKEEINRLELNIIDFQGLAFVEDNKTIYNKAKRLVGEVDDSTNIGLLSSFSENIEILDIKYPIIKFQQNFAKRFKKTILGLANFEPLGLENLPSNIKNKFTSNTGTFLVKAYPKRNIWKDTEFLFQLRKETNELSTASTGLSLIFVELLDMILYELKRNSWMVFGIIVLMLLIVFKKIQWIVLGVTPMIFALLWILGIMSVFNFQLNLYHLLILPLLIGIGLQNGIYIIMKYKNQVNSGAVYNTTGRGILIATTVNMLGFGLLCTSLFSGIHSISFSVFVGLGSYVLSIIFLIPTLLPTDRI